jgi:hypothetical protein
MILRKRTKDPKPLISLGMLALAISIAWPRFIPIGAHIPEDLVDGVKGMLLGFALGLLIWGGMLGGFNRHASGK